MHFKTGKNTQKLAKLLSQNLVQGWVKTWSKYVAQQNWTRFWLKKCVFFSLFFCSFFFKISFSLQKEEDFWKTKKEKKRENLDQVLTQKKANLGPGFDSTAYITIVMVLLFLSEIASITFFVNHEHVLCSKIVMRIASFTREKEANFLHPADCSQWKHFEYLLCRHDSAKTWCNTALPCSRSVAGSFSARKSQVQHSAGWQGTDSWWTDYLSPTAEASETRKILLPKLLDACSSLIWRILHNILYMNWVTPEGTCDKLRL